MSKSKEPNDNSETTKKNKQEIENSELNFEMSSQHQNTKKIPLSNWMKILPIMISLLSGAFIAGIKFQGEILRKNDIIQELSNNNENLKKRNDTLSVENDRLENENKQLGDSILTLKRENSKLSIDFQDVNKELKNEKEVNNSHKAETKRPSKSEVKDVKQTQTIDTVEVHFEMVDFEYIKPTFAIFLDDNLEATESKEKFSLFIPQGSHILKIQYHNQAKQKLEFSKTIIVKDKNQNVLKINKNEFDIKKD